MLEMGLTERGIDDIGDVSSIQLVVHKNNLLSEGDDLLRIEWEGHSITSADELYHTVWENFSGVTILKSPLDGRIESSDISYPWIEEESPLVNLAVSRECLARALPKLLSADEYLLQVSNLKPGRFSAAHDCS